MCLQETWFTENVDDLELSNGTPFILYRADRAAFKKQKKLGGGLVVLVHEKFESEDVILAEVKSTLLEYICVRIKTPSQELLLLNLYSAPYRKSFRLEDLSRILFAMSQQTAVPWIIIGDFNQTGIKWVYSEDVMGAMAIVEKTFHADEQSFINAKNRYALNQMVSTPNSRGNFLDLVLTKDANMVSTSIPSAEDVFDQNSINHNSIEISVMVNSSPEEEEVYVTAHNYKKVRHNHVSNLLARIPAFEEDSRVVNLCDDFAGYIKELLDKNSPLVRKGIAPKQTKHPWTTGSREYSRIEKFKTRLYSAYKKNKTAETKAAYIEALVATRTAFIRLKVEYFEKVVDAGGASTMEFYNLMKFKRTSRRAFPARMSFKGVWYKGDEIARAMAASLISNFDMSDRSLGGSFFDNRSVLWDIYQTHFQQDKMVLWEQYTGIIDEKTSKRTPGQCAFRQI